MISKREYDRRRRANADLFPLAEIDAHNDAGTPCELCQRPATAGECFEDSDLVRVCVRCYWTRTDRRPVDPPKPAKTGAK